MKHYPDCPFCENSNSALSVVDVEIDGVQLKGIFCNSCKKYLGFFQDVKPQIEELKGMMKNDANASNDDSKQNATNASANDGTTGTTTKKSKSSSI